MNPRPWVCDPWLWALLATKNSAFKYPMGVGLRNFYPPWPWPLLENEKWILSKPMTMRSFPWPWTPPKTKKSPTKGNPQWWVSDPWPWAQKILHIFMPMNSKIRNSHSQACKIFKIDSKCTK